MNEKIFSCGCYFCGETVVSQEHVPPKVIFPKNMRRNLIKVDSCDLHNSAKSMDDVYLWYLLSGCSKNINKEQLEKIKRSVIRKPKLAIAIVENTNRNIYIPDSERLHNSLESIIRGLFFHKNKKRCVEVSTLIAAFSDTNNEKYELAKVLAGKVTTAFESEGIHIPYEGDNPLIFKYREINNFFELCFFSDLMVYAIAK